MNTCDGCEHWHNPWDDEHGETWLVGTDEAPRWGTCRLIGLHDKHEGYASVTLPAFTRDGSDYKADLHTRADFGCTLWAPKEGETRVQAAVAEAVRSYSAGGPAFAEVLREVIVARQARGELPAGEVRIACDEPSSSNPSGVMLTIVSDGSPAERVRANVEASRQVRQARRLAASARGPVGEYIRVKLQKAYDAAWAAELERFLGPTPPTA